MEIVLVITGTILIVIQFQRNLLLKKQLENQTITNVTVQPTEVNYDSLAKAMESSWPTVTVQNDLEIDYNKLENAIKMALIESGVALHNVQIPVQIPAYPVPVPIPQPSPYWQSPTISKDSTGEIEVDGVKGKQFPAR